MRSEEVDLYFGLVFLIATEVIAMEELLEQQPTPTPPGDESSCPAETQEASPTSKSLQDCLQLMLDSTSGDRGLALQSLQGIVDNLSKVRPVTVCHTSYPDQRL